MPIRSRLERWFYGPRPEIVCLCGSTRFFDEFRRQNLRLTCAGKIVLSIGYDTKSDGDLFGVDDLAVLKDRLDELHKRKIDLCDWVLVLDVGGYIGESTRSEIDYALRIGRPVRYLSQGDHVVVPHVVVPGGTMAADQGIQHGAAPMQFTENRKGLDSMGVPAPEPVTLPASPSGPPVDYDG